MISAHKFSAMNPTADATDLSRKFTIASIMPGNAARALSPSFIRRFAILWRICFIHSLGLGLGSGNGPGGGFGGSGGFGFGFGVADFTPSVIDSASAVIANPIAVSNDTIVTLVGGITCRFFHLE